MIYRNVAHAGLHLHLSSPLRVLNPAERSIQSKSASPCASTRRRGKNRREVTQMVKGLASRCIKEPQSDDVGLHSHVVGHLEFSLAQLMELIGTIESC